MKVKMLFKLMIHELLMLWLLIDVMMMIGCFADDLYHDCIEFVLLVVMLQIGELYVVVLNWSCVRMLILLEFDEKLVRESKQWCSDV